MPTAAQKHTDAEVLAAFQDEARRLAAVVEEYLKLPRRREVVVDAKGKRSFSFTPEVLKLCRRTACKNEIILWYYKSRAHSSRKGKAPRRARPVSPITLDGWSRRYPAAGLLLFMPMEKQPATSGDARRLSCDVALVNWVLAAWRPWDTPHRFYCALRKEALTRGWELPSRAWFYRQWPAICNALTTWNRDEPDYHRDAETIRNIFRCKGHLNHCQQPPRVT